MNQILPIQEKLKWLASLKWIRKSGMGLKKLGPLEISRWYLASCARHDRLIVSIFLEKINRSFRRPPFAFHTAFHALLSPSGKSSLWKTSGKMDYFSNYHYFHLNPAKMHLPQKLAAEIERIILQKCELVNSKVYWYWKRFLLIGNGFQMSPLELAAILRVRLFQKFILTSRHQPQVITTKRHLRQ